MRPTRHALPGEARSNMVALLTRRVADAFDLRSQTKHAHWNTRGPDFRSLHVLYDELAATIDAQVDALAERAAALGGTVPGTVRMTARTTSLVEMPLNADGHGRYLDALIDGYATHAKNVSDDVTLAEEAGDRGTADLLTRQVGDLDQALYLLEAHIPVQSTSPRLSARP